MATHTAPWERFGEADRWVWASRGAAAGGILGRWRCGFLTTLHPDLWEEVRAMSKTPGKRRKFDFYAREKGLPGSCRS